MPTQHQGTIVTWKDEQGYGFIQPDGENTHLFLHISAMKKYQRRPRQGDRVRFEIVTNEQRGQPQAAHVGIEGIALSWTLRSGLGLWLAGVLVLILFFLTGLDIPAQWAGYLGLCLVVSPITFEVYGVDKRRAGAQQLRIPETTLHLLELLGGWPGALVAQYHFRHKVKKPSYQFVFWIIVFLHAVFIVAVLIY